MMKRVAIIGSVMCATTIVSACATIEKSKQTICAKKAEAVQAAQAVIDTLNQYCPLENAPTIDSDDNVPD